MFDTGGDPRVAESVGAPALGGATGDDDVLDGIKRAFAGFVPAADPAMAIEQIGSLRQIIAMASAAMARVTPVFVAARRAEQLAAGVPAKEIGRGIASEVALAKRESPHRAQRYLGFAKILTAELPETYAALCRGETTEWRAMLVARETGWLSLDDRTTVDRKVGPQLGKWGDRRVEHETRRRASSLDPVGQVARIRSAPNERHVSLRPAPDVMTRLTALLPMKQGVAVLAALNAAAATAIRIGDERSRGQLMADTLVERVTGQAHANDVPITINVIMTDQTLLNAGAARNSPGTIQGAGPIPAGIARDLAVGSDGEVPRWIRRLFADPKTGQLVTMETHSRLFTPAQREFLRLRDQTCRTPYCDAPIRHADHVIPAEAGGPTALTNGQGLCEACNQAKQAAGWTSRRLADADIATVTPTGHTYRSRAPDLMSVA